MSEQTGDPAAEAPSRGRVLVLGVGNTHQGDDGFGPAVLAALMSEGVSNTTVLADGGVLGVDLLNQIEDYERMIVVDAVRSASSQEKEDVGGGGLETGTGRRQHWVSQPNPVPGGVVVFRLSEVELEDPDPRFSLHDLSFGGSLRLARVLKLRLPEIWIVGYVLPSWSSLARVGLSEEAQRAVAPACAAVRRLLMDS